ncbi:MAG: ATP synthase F0 subunit B [Planctomycetaceae bacterium]|nr:ATP synthase F0 subunit B [Planctomycetaceae bacterium]
MTAGLLSPAICWAADDAGGHEAGVRGDLAFWSLVTFVGFVLVIRKLGWQSFVDGLEGREKAQNDAIAEAESKNQQAQASLSEQRGLMEAIDEEVRERIAEAHRDAEYTTSEISASARRESELLKDRALGEIERTRDQALHELFDSMSARVVDQARLRLSDRLSGEDHERLIGEAIDYIASHNAS